VVDEFVMHFHRIAGYGVQTVAPGVLRKMLAKGIIFLCELLNSVSGRWIEVELARILTLLR